MLYEHKLVISFRKFCFLKFDLCETVLFITNTKNEHFTIAQS